MSKQKRVANLYYKCVKKKDKLRSNYIESSRIESIAESVFGKQMVAIAVYSMCYLDVDLGKILLMILLSEFEPFEFWWIFRKLSKYRELRNIRSEFYSKNSREARYTQEIISLENALYHNSDFYKEYIGYPYVMSYPKVKQFYQLCNKLKTTIRTGWIDWNVQKERLESVADHIFGVEIYNIGIWSEFKPELDIKKMLIMAAIHETGEIVIGDYSLDQIPVNEKREMEHKAVHDVFSNLPNGMFFENLFLEFDYKKPAEAQMCYFSDKLECDSYSKVYERYVDLSHQESNRTFNRKDVQDLLNAGNSFSEMWIKLGQDRYHYDADYRAVSNYVLKNKLR